MEIENLLTAIGDAVLTEISEVADVTYPNKEQASFVIETQDGSKFKVSVEAL